MYMFFLALLQTWRLNTFKANFMLIQPTSRKFTINSSKERISGMLEYYGVTHSREDLPILKRYDGYMC